MHADVLVEVVGVVESEAFKALQVGCEFVKFGEAATTFLLNANLDFANPTALEFNTLSDDFLLEPWEIRSLNTKK